MERGIVIMKSVLVGMSGGVDSAVAALLLKNKGYRVIGYTLKFGKEANKCCKIDDAFFTAKQLGIEYFTLDIYEEFEKEIVQYFINSYLLGKTPSPCPKCNIFKFGMAIEYAKKENIDYVATGHYAKVKNGKLFSVDNVKDQAYFLSLLPKNFFEKIILPLGDYEKSEIRNIAEKAGLHIAQKKDSQDICFVETDYKDFLFSRGIKSKKGMVIDKNGKKLGEHSGYFLYTVGQRFRLGGMDERLYVLKTIPEKNIVIAGKNEELFSDKLKTAGFNLIVDEKELFTGDIYLKVRSRDSFHPAIIESYDKEDGIMVKFKESVRAITPGQLAVVYKKYEDELMVLGGGWIEE